MDFCREMHISYAEYLEQPADVMVGWYQMLAAEREGIDMAKRIQEAHAKLRKH